MDARLSRKGEKKGWENLLRKKDVLLFFFPG